MFHAHEGCELCLQIPAFARRLSVLTEEHFGRKLGVADMSDSHSHADWDVCTSECTKWIEQGI